MKRNILLAITVLFFAMGAYKAWEEQYEKADAAGKASIAGLHQTKVYQDKFQEKDNLIQSQTTTIQTYQAQLAACQRKLADIEEANDPSAKAVKKRVLILCNQLEAFYREYSTNQEALFNQDFGQDMIEQAKTGIWPPTNAIQKAEWEAIITKRGTDISNKERAFEAEWAAKFTTDFYGRMTAARDQLASLGLESESLNSHIRKPFFTSAYWSHELTMELERLANQIKE